jgi:hypothetical protein
MAITVNSHKYTVFGDRAVVMADVAFDSSYAGGGESLSISQQFGLHDLDIVLIETKGGYSFEWDYTDQKVKAFAPAPAIVYEEKHTPSSDMVTTNYPAAYFMNVARSGGNKAWRSTGIALASLSDDQCCLVAQMAAGERTSIRVKDYDRLGGDGAFTGGTTNWTFSDSQNDWTYGTNNVAKDQDGTETMTHDNFAATVGHKYLISYTISGEGTKGTLTVTCGGTAGAAQTLANGTFTEEITATTTDGLVFTPSNSSRFTIDSITVYDLSEPVYLTYITQAWKEVWENLVQDEEITLKTGANTLASGNKVLACMYIDQTEATAAALTMIDSDDTAASGEIKLLFNSATNQLTANAAQNGKDTKITYLKVPPSGFLADRAFSNETADKAGEDPYTSTFDYPILIWGYTGQVPINGGTTLRLIDYAGTPVTGEAVIDWYTPGVRGAGAPAAGAVVGTKDDVTATGAGVWGTIQEIQNKQPLEVPNGSDLSALSSVKMIFIGR